MLSPKHLSPFLARTAAAGTLFIASISASASMITTSTTIPQFSSTASDLVQVSGLNKFDPSLGTLTGVNFKVVSEYAAEVDLIASVEDETSPHEIDASVSFQMSISVRNPGGGGQLFASEVDSAQFSCNDGSFSDACTDFFTELVSGSINEEQDATTRLSDAGRLNDFVGSGELDFIEYGLFFFANGGLDVLFADNITAGDANIAFDLGPTTLSIEYSFTPVPVPAAVWFLAPALALLFARRRSAR